MWNHKIGKLHPKNVMISHQIFNTDLMLIYCLFSGEIFVNSTEKKVKLHRKSCKLTYFICEITK